MNFKLLTLVLMTVIFAYHLLLMALERRSANNPMPANVADVYDAERYAKWRAYHAEKTRLGMISAVVGYVVSMALIALDAYAAFASLFPDTPWLQLLAVVLLSALAGLATLPIDYVDTMVIEEKYGFNRTTVKTFWLDQVKNFVIGLLLILLLGTVLMWLHQWLGPWMLPAFAAVMTVIMLAISFLYPVFSRIFNKFTPMSEGEVRDRLTELLTKHGYRVRAIEVMDGSRRSTKSNAYFTGFGRMKTIVIYDTMMEKMTPDEICAVFAHELGHGLHRDTLKQSVLGFVQWLILAALAVWTLETPALFTDFGFAGVNYGFALMLIMEIEFALISPLYGLLVSWYSRRAEYRADAQAVQEGYAQALIAGLKKLSVENFANLAPDKWLVRLEYSHPTLSQRIEAIERAERSATGKGSAA